MDGAKNTVARPVKFCAKVWIGGIAKNADGKKPGMADAEPKTPAVQEGKKCSKREGSGPHP